MSTYAFFMKEPDDSIRIRRRIGECFELAGDQMHRPLLLKPSPYIVLVVFIPHVPLSSRSESGKSCSSLRASSSQIPILFSIRALYCSFSSLAPSPASPSTPLEEKRRLLSFYIVGGGPTGVEFAATLSDYVSDELPALGARFPLDP